MVNSRGTVPVLEDDAGPLEIGFQARYLNDITDQIPEQVEFRFADGSAPTVVQTQSTSISPRHSTSTIVTLR